MISRRPHLKSGIERNLGVGNLDNIEILDLSLEEAKKQTPKFKVPGNTFTNFIAYMSRQIGYKIIKKIPELNKGKIYKMLLLCSKMS
jgi:hypothetical protein